MCDITAAVVAGGAVMGAASAATSKPKTPTTTTATSENKAPWDPQANYLRETFDKSTDNMRNALDRGPYQGSTSAGMTDMTRAGIDSAAGYATGTGAALAGQTAGTAATLQNGAAGYAARAGALADQGTGPMNATSAGVLTSAANGGTLAGPNANTQAGAAQTGAAFQTAQALGAQAQGDPAARALATGGAYANDPTVQAQIDDAALDVTRNFNERTAPGLNASASSGGNLNSARAGIAEGLARRDAGESIGRISSQIRSAALDTGVKASLEGNSQNNALALGANAQAASIGQSTAQLGESARQADASNVLAAATTLGSQDIQNRSLDASTRLAANGQVGSGVQMGINGAVTAGQLADANAGRLVDGGTLLQQENQRALDADQEAYMRDYNYRQGILSNQMGIIGTQNWGSNTNGNSQSVGTAPQSPGILQGAMGGAAMGAGLSGPANQAYKGWLTS